MCNALTIRGTRKKKKDKQTKRRTDNHDWEVMHAAGVDVVPNTTQHCIACWKWNPMPPPHTSRTLAARLHIVLFAFIRIHISHCSGSPFVFQFTSHSSRFVSLSESLRGLYSVNSVMWSKHKYFFFLLTQHLTEYRSAILAMTCIASIKWICKLNKCISFVHWNSCWQIKKHCSM